MTRCSQNHEPIEHDEFHCPLCAALEDLNAAEDRICGLEQAYDALADETDAADVLQLMAQAESASQRAYAAEQAFNALRWAVLHTKTAPMGRYISRIQAAAK